MFAIQAVGKGGTGEEIYVTGANRYEKGWKRILYCSARLGKADQGLLGEMEDLCKGITVVSREPDPFY